jgi:hypothetical protein
MFRVVARKRTQAKAEIIAHVVDPKAQNKYRPQKTPLTNRRHHRLGTPSPLTSNSQRPGNRQFRQASHTATAAPTSASN